MRIHKMLAACAAIAALAPAAVLAQATDFPNKTIRFVIAFPAGNATDIVGRLIGDKVQASVKQSVIPENQGGGNAILGAAVVARAPADGYTVLIATNSVQSAAPYLTKNLPFDP